MIGIINYGLGNINAIKNIYDEYNIKTHEISSEDSFKPEIKKIILPGVGSFDNAINNLKEINLFQKLLEFSKIKKNYLLGICVGMQILANKSEEGTQKGLGIIPGRIVKFNSNYVTPNMGWRTINMKNTNLIFKNISNQSKFYFLHSYYFEPDSQNHILSDTIYYKKFPSIVFNKNIFGIQFHPEKSHDDGKKILLNFYNL